MSFKQKPQNFMGFHTENFKDLNRSEKVLTRSIFELEKCSFINGSEFRQKLIGNVISELHQQNL